MVNVKERRLQILKMVADHEHHNQTGLMTHFEIAGGIEGTDSEKVEKHQKETGQVCLWLN